VLRLKFQAQQISGVDDVLDRCWEVACQIHGDEV
jgi:hypothetical protein